MANQIEGGASNIAPIRDGIRLPSIAYTNRGGTPPGDGGGGMDIEIERRLTAIETALPYLATKTDISETKTEIAHAEGRIKGKLETDFRIQFAALITVALSLAGLMAKGFHWL